MHDGYLRLYRCMMDKGWTKDPDFVAVWIALLMRATHREKEMLVDGQIKKLQPGQLLTSRKSLAENTGVNESKIERVLKVFKSEQQIEQVTTAKYRVISITNWAKYQHSEQQNEQLVNSWRTAGEHNQECKNKRIKSLKTLPKKPSAISRIFIDWFCYAYEVVQETAYIFEGGKDGKAIKDILTEQNWKQMIIRASFFLTDKKRFPPEKAPTLTFFRQKINDYPDSGDISACREMGILPPEGVKFEDWDYRGAYEQQTAIR
jgi:DNA-binding transcriptional regulator YhcF (GntR family)